MISKGKKQNEMIDYKQFTGISLYISVSKPLSCSSTPINLLSIALWYICSQVYWLCTGCAMRFKLI